MCISGRVSVLGERGLWAQNSGFPFQLLKILADLEVASAQNQSWTCRPCPSGLLVAARHFF